MMKGEMISLLCSFFLGVVAYSSILTKEFLRIHHTGNAERSRRLRRSRMPRMMKGDVGMHPPPKRLRIRLGPLGIVDVEGLSPRLLSRVSLLLSTVEEGNAERMGMMKEDVEVFPPLRLMRIRLGPVGAVDVEGPSPRLQSGVLLLLSTVEEGNVERMRMMMMKEDVEVLPPLRLMRIRLMKEDG